MDRYVKAVGRANELPFFLESFTLRHPRREPLTVHVSALRPLVQTFVEGHLKRRVRDLRNVYVRLEQPLDSSSPKAVWLQSTQANLQELQDSLFSWSRVWRAIVAIVTGQFVGAVIGLLLAKAGEDSLSGAVLGLDTSTVLYIVGVTVFVALWTMLVVDTSFWAKRLVLLTTGLDFVVDGRKLELTANDPVGLHNSPGQYKIVEPVPANHGVYGAEQQLADTLGIARRRREFPIDTSLDALCAVLYIVPLVGFTIWAWTTDDSTSDKLTLTLIPGVPALAILVWAIVRVVYGQRRNPR
jgi:hypothetical protein